MGSLLVRRRGTPEEREVAPGDGSPFEPAGPGDGGDGGDDDGHDGHGGGLPGDPHRAWVTLATFWHPAEAHIARLRLEAGGVACVLLDELTAAMPVLSILAGGVKLKVPRVQARRAARLLRTGRAGAAPASRASVALAQYERLIEAKAAACVVEAAGLACEVIEHLSGAARPTWARLLPHRARAWLWPAGSLAVAREDLMEAAAALRATPLGAGLRGAARRGWCAACTGCGGWPTWQLHWSDRGRGAPAALHGRAESGGPACGIIGRFDRLPRLVRRCGGCGRPWTGSAEA